LPYSHPATTLSWDTDLINAPAVNLPRRVVALTPSQDLGGGIEAYTKAVLDAVRELGVEVVEFALASPSHAPRASTQVRYLAQILKASGSLRHTDTEIMCFHIGLLPAAILARRCVGTAVPITTFFYGIGDIWASSSLDRLLRRRSSVRPITISSFSTGMMMGDKDLRVLTPSVSASLARNLLAIEGDSRPAQGAHVLSVFRLGDYAGKGGSELVRAVAALRSEGYSVTLTLAGRDAPNELLDRDLERFRDWMTVVRSPSMATLIGCYTEASLFALATREHGEGFGIVLAEAALAALPVLGPACGGSRDAFIEGVTGVSPRDHSIGSLTDLLRWMLDHPQEVRTMGVNGRTWARQAFDPACYPARVANVLWGKGAYPYWLDLQFA
jgi:phosphatidyl-myo-inositol dimannoside synthase